MKAIKLIAAVVILFSLESCATKYITPGSNVNISKLADEDISKLLSNKPAAEFPVNMAIAKIQSPSYTNWRYQNNLYNEPKGQFSMVLTRNPEEENGFERLNKLEGIKQASTFNRLLLPYNYNSVKDLRLAAAKMKAEILLVYTFDTKFTINTKNFGPQNAFTLGYLKNKEVKVTTTASVAIFDVQTEYLYGLTESTASQIKKSNAWRKQKEVDALRIETEGIAFEKLMDDVENLWEEIIKEYSVEK